MVSFIYQPKSGDRVFIEQQSPWIVVIRWGNGCRHVAGNFVVLSWSTAIQGQYWRHEAVRALREIIPQVGGIAWDAQGTVSACVPTHQAKMVIDLMGRISPNDHDDRDRNLVELWRVGAGRISFTDIRGLDIEPSFVSVPPQVQRVVRPKQNERGEVLVYMDGTESPHVIKSPWTPWEITSPVTPEEAEDYVDQITLTEYSQNHEPRSVTIPSLE